MKYYKSKRALTKLYVTTTAYLFLLGMQVYTNYQKDNIIWFWISVSLGVLFLVFVVFVVIKQRNKHLIEISETFFYSTITGKIAWRKIEKIELELGHTKMYARIYLKEKIRKKHFNFRNKTLKKSLAVDLSNINASEKDVFKDIINGFEKSKQHAVQSN